MLRSLLHLVSLLPVPVKDSGHCRTGAMQSWVKTLRPTLAKVSATDDITLVVGNEACDLDSGVSALTYAFHLASLCPGRAVLPLLNIPAIDYPLRTELVYCLEQANIQEEDLIFKEEIQMKEFQKLEVVLVDHNVDTDYPAHVVTEVLDHHARELPLSSPIRCTIEPVGSCATLVAERIFADNPGFEDKTALGLLRDTIVLDTVCLSQAAKRVTEKDRLLLSIILTKLGEESADLQAIYDQIWSAKCRTDHLTPHQLLRRDLKCFSAGQELVAVSAVPMLVDTFLQLPNIQQDAEQFMKEGGFSLVVVLGIQITDGHVTRDLFILKSGQPNLMAAAIKGLTECREPDLQLTHEERQMGVYLTQGNAACSRKQILPILKKSLSAN